MKVDLEELITLRISVARIAQALGLDNDLSITDKNYSHLAALAEHRDRGWNDLAGRIFEHVSENRTSTESGSGKVFDTAEEARTEDKACAIEAFLYSDDSIYWREVSPREVADHILAHLDQFRELLK